jgi:deazaflavin-dependent oxidoreductase (nitroreductase family)
MDPDGPVPPSMADDLAAWGKVITLETRGRHSGRPRRVTIGFADEPGGGMLVAAADDATQWARNLAAEPRCQVERDGRRAAYLAAPLTGRARSAAIAALILKYGTPSERLGAGPAFRLVPTTPAK